MVDFDLFSALPSGIVQDIISVWLDMKDMAHLDSALLNSETRQQFLDLLKATIFLNCKVNHRMTTWAILRSIKVGCLDASDLRNRVEDIFQITGRHLRSLRAMNNGPGLAQSENYLQYAAEYCTSLQSIAYSGYTADLPLLNKLFNRNSDIQTLTLKAEHLLAQHDLKTCKICCPNLRTLSIQLNCSEKNTLETVLMMTSSCPLRSLQLTKCAFAKPADILKILACCPNLHSLAIEEETLDDDTMIAAVALCPLLVDLDLSHNPQITDNAMVHINKHLKVRTLMLNNCPKLTGISLSTVLQYSYATLTAVSVQQTFLAITGSRVTMSLCAILTSCKLLTTLSFEWRNRRDHYLSNIVRLSLNGADDINAGFNFVGENCPKVQILSLTGFANSVSIDSSKLHNLLLKCPQLHTLFMPSAYSRDEVRALFGSICAKRLLKLRVCCDLKGSHMSDLFDFTA